MAFLIIIICGVILLVVLLRKNSSTESNPQDPELFSTTTYEKPDNINYAKCPQCGKEAKVHEDVKRDFGLRKVGYATDIQSWCRECRRNKDNEESNEVTKTIDKELDLFKKED